VIARAACLLLLVLVGCFDPVPNDPTCGRRGECPDGTRCIGGPGGVCSSAPLLCADVRDTAIAACMEARVVEPDAGTEDEDAHRLALRRCGVGAGDSALVECCAHSPDVSCGPPLDSCSAPVPVVASVTVATDIETAFAALAATGTGWTGGDKVYSNRLPGGRILWTFANTYLGPVTGNTRPPAAPLLQSAFVLDDGGALTTVKQSSLLPAEADGAIWYWPADGVVEGDHVDRLFHRYQRTGAAQFEYGVTGNVRARFAIADLVAEPATGEPRIPLRLAWGLSIIPAAQTGDGYTYVFGIEKDVDDKGAPQQYAIVARYPGDQMLGAWEYLTASRAWTVAEIDVGRVVAGAVDPYSVQRVGSSYVMISHSGPLSDTIVARSACQPWGPYSEPVPVYRTPESGDTGTYHNGAVFTHNSHGHRELSEGNQVLISYNANSFQGGDVLDDVTLFRPRFLRVLFGPGL
jgi:hypothetical protein